MKSGLFSLIVYILVGIAVVTPSCTGGRRKGCSYIQTQAATGKNSPWKSKTIKIYGPQFWMIKIHPT